MTEATFSFDLHVLGTPPAFVLSQDQTLQLNAVRKTEVFLTYIVRSDLSPTELLLARNIWLILLFSFQRPIDFGTLFKS